MGGSAIRCTYAPPGGIRSGSTGMADVSPGRLARLLDVVHGRSGSSSWACPESMTAATALQHDNRTPRGETLFNIRRVLRRRREPIVHQSPRQAENRTDRM